MEDCPFFRGKVTDRFYLLSSVPRDVRGGIVPQTASANRALVWGY